MVKKNSTPRQSTSREIQKQDEGEGFETIFYDANSENLSSFFSNNPGLKPKSKTRDLLKGSQNSSSKKFPRKNRKKTSSVLCSHCCNNLDQCECSQIEGREESSHLVRRSEKDTRDSRSKTMYVSQTSSKSKKHKNKEHVSISSGKKLDSLEDADLERG